MSRQTDFAEIKALKEKVRSWRRVAEKLREEASTLTQQRNALLDALEGLITYHYHNDMGVKPKEYHAAKAVIKKAK